MFIEVLVTHFTWTMWLLVRNEWGGTFGIPTRELGSGAEGWGWVFRRTSWDISNVKFIFWFLFLGFIFSFLDSPFWYDSLKYIRLGYCKRVIVMVTGWISYLELKNWIFDQSIRLQYVAEESCPGHSSDGVLSRLRAEFDKIRGSGIFGTV